MGHVGLSLPDEPPHLFLRLPRPNRISYSLERVHPAEPRVVLHEGNDLVAHPLQQGYLRLEDGILTAGLEVVVVDETYSKHIRTFLEVGKAISVNPQADFRVCYSPFSEHLFLAKQGSNGPTIPSHKILIHYLRPSKDDLLILHNKF
ncbi:hypothetical protein ARMA_0860 [Ardenticatena maritima]|uniref:Uncharacterized protein n=1 Tax=Ardenticatena maritima TaxID=872965 RepID=A0A0M9UC09_9CHLR|nr:hypothetical protein ARMA_0860 [Ardenticatena maritima]